MPVISDALEALADWLKGQPFTPSIRETAVGPTAQPPAVYPRALISAEAESFYPHTQDTTARIIVELACQGGRHELAASQARSLAHQLRRALYSSATLGGVVKQLYVERIVYRVGGDELPGNTALAQLHLRVLYHEAAAST